MLFTLINPISGRRGEERRGEEQEVYTSKLVQLCACLA
jgi:hypothetical protein